jgi:hypothetical protein
MGNTQNFQQINNNLDKNDYYIEQKTHGDMIIQVITYEDEKRLLILKKEKWYENGSKKSEIIFPNKNNNFVGKITKFYGKRKYVYRFENNKY